MGKNFTAVVDGKPVSIFWVFRRYLVEFMAALVTYKTAKEDQTELVPGCTSGVLKKRIQKFFAAQYPELLDCWKGLVADGHSSFYWTGPDFTIQPLMMDAHRIQTYEVQGWEIYATIAQGSLSEDDSDHSDDEGEAESEDEAPPMVIVSSREPEGEKPEGGKRKLDIAGKNSSVM